MEPLFNCREITLHPLQPEIDLGMIIDNQREFLVETLIHILPFQGDGSPHRSMLFGGGT